MVCNQRKNPQNLIFLTAEPHGQISSCHWIIQAHRGRAGADRSDREVPLVG